MQKGWKMGERERTSRQNRNQVKEVHKYLNQLTEVSTFPGKNPTLNMIKHQSNETELQLLKPKIPYNKTNNIKMLIDH